MSESHFGMSKFVFSQDFITDHVDNLVLCFNVPDFLICGFVFNVFLFRCVSLATEAKSVARVYDSGLICGYLF